MSTWNVFWTVIGMGAVTLLCRSFFLLFSEELPMPRWLRDGLQYAPLAALAAVVAPEVVLAQGAFIASWQNSRLIGAMAGLLFFLWTRSLFGTIVVGTLAMLVLRIGAGWP